MADKKQKKLVLEATVVAGSFAHEVLQKLQHEFNKAEDVDLSSADARRDEIDRLWTRLNKLVALNAADYARTGGAIVQILGTVPSTKESFEEDWWRVRDIKTGEEREVESEDLTPLGPLEVLAELTDE
jgi:hypothetical protein